MLAMKISEVVVEEEEIWKKDQASSQQIVKEGAIENFARHQ